MGLLWFWATDPAVPEAVRRELLSYGHCTDEYDADSDPPFFPPELYVREGRRLVSDWVWTAYKVPLDKAERSVGLGSYSFDSHYVSRLIHRTGTAAGDYVVKEGRVDSHSEQSPTHTTERPDDEQVRDQAVCAVCMNTPFEMPYDVIIPSVSDVHNLLVPVAVSASHVRFNAIRMEPAWMILGHAAGTAAALTVNDTSTSKQVYGDVHTVNVTELQQVLINQKQLLRYLL